MEKSSKVRDLSIGVIFLGALAILGMASLTVANIPFLKKYQTITVPFKKVNTVRVGDKILIYGLPIGLVSSVAPSLENPLFKVKLACRIDEPISLPPDSLFEVRSAGPLGGRYIEIIPGKSKESVPIAQGQFTGDAKGDLFEELGKVVDEIRDGNGLLQQLVRNETLGSNFTDTMAEVREIVHNIHEGEGLLGAVINRPDIRDNFDTVLSNLSDSLYNIRTSQGALGMFINDPEVRDSIKKFIANAEDISTHIKEGKGTVGKLIFEDKIANDLEAMIDRAKKVFDEIENGQGTLGQLIKNPEVHHRLKRILVQVEDAVEDFREQAPISTFVNAIFSGF